MCIIYFSWCKLWLIPKKDTKNQTDNGPPLTGRLKMSISHPFWKNEMEVNLRSAKPNFCKNALAFKFQRAASSKSTYLGFMNRCCNHGRVLGCHILIFIFLIKRPYFLESWNPCSQPLQCRDWALLMVFVVGPISMLLHLKLVYSFTLISFYL